MSHDELTARLDKQDKVLEAIHTALVGNGALGNPGLVKRIEDVEEKQKTHDKTMMKWAGVAAGAALVVTTFKDRLFGS